MKTKKDGSIYNHYKEGDILELTMDLDDPYVSVPAGSQMRVEFTDDAGQIHGAWLNANTSVALVPKVDHFKVIHRA